MKRDKTDKIIERHIIEAIVRKGEQQEVVEELQKIDSEDDLRQILSSAEKKHSRVLRSSALNRRAVAMILAAAMVAVVLIIGFQPRYSTGRLYEQWYESPVYEPRVSRGAEEVDSPQKAMFDKAGVLYERGELLQALSLYEQASAFAPDKITDEVLFYWAAALAQTGKADDAIAKFSQLAADTVSEYSGEAAWQLSMAYLRIDKRKEATRELERIAASDGLFAERARELIIEIRCKIIF